MQFVVNLDVDDLARAVRFYVDAFGLRPGRRFGDDFIELLGGPAPIYLLVKPAGSAATPTTGQQRSYARHWTPMHLDIVVDQIEVAVERALAAGATLEVPVATRNWGKLAGLADPFGHGFCLIEFIGGGYDEICDNC